MIDSRARVLCVEYAGGNFFDACVFDFPLLIIFGGFCVFWG